MKDQEGRRLKERTAGIRLRPAVISRKGGVVSGYVCPERGVCSGLSGAGGGEQLADGPRVAGCRDTGAGILDGHPDSEASQIYPALAYRLQGEKEIWREGQARRFTLSEALR